MIKLLQFILKIFVAFLIVLVILLGVLFFFRNPILKQAVTIGVTMSTGFRTSVDNIRLDVSPGLLQIQGFKMENPREFKNPIFVDLPELYISLDVPAFIGGKGVHSPLVRINLQEVTIEKNKSGISNLDRLSGGKKAPQQPKATPSPAEKPQAGEKKAMPFKVDRLELTMRKVKYEDNSSYVPIVVPVDLGIQNQVYENIQDFGDIRRIMLDKIFKSQAGDEILSIVPKNLNFGSINISEFGQSALSGATELLGTTTTQATIAAGNVLSGTVSQATNALGVTGKTAKEKLSGFLVKVKSQLPSTKVSEEK